MVKIGKKNTPAQAKSAGSIRVAQSTYQKALIKKLLTQVLIALMAVLLIYLCFAATIVRFVPAAGGPVLVKNNTYPGGILPPDSSALVTLNPAKKINGGIGDRIQQAFLPQANTATVEVLAGPIGKLDWVEPGILTVDGKSIDVPVRQDPGIEFLGAKDAEGVAGPEYVGVCVSGSCVPGSPVFFSTSNVYGIPITEQSFDSAPDWALLKNPDRTRPTAPALAEFLVAAGKSPTQGRGLCQARAVLKTSLSDDLLARAVTDIETLSDSEFKNFDTTVNSTVKGCSKAGGKS